MYFVRLSSIVPWCVNLPRSSRAWMILVTFSARLAYSSSGIWSSMSLPSANWFGSLSSASVSRIRRLVSFDAGRLLLAIMILA